MKTLQIARGIAAVLSLAGVTGLVGCGAETGAPEAEIGSTSQAATLTPTLPAGLVGIQSCKVHDSGANKDYIVFAGGITNTPSAINTVDAIDTSNDTLVLRAAAGNPLFGKTLSTARGFGKTIEVGDDCYVLGGTTRVDNAAAAVNNVDKIHVASGTWTVGSAGVTLGTARNDFTVLPCGSSNYIVAGGQDNGSFINSLEVFTPSTPAFASVTGTLSEARSIMQAAFLDSSHDKMIFAGGEKSGGTSSKIDVVTVSSSACAAANVTVAQLKDDANTSNFLLLTSTNGSGARRGGGAFSVDTLALGGTHKDRIAIAAGFKPGLGLQAATDTLEITDWSTPKGKFNAAATVANINVSTARPELLFVGQVPHFIGGADETLRSSASASVSASQSYAAPGIGNAWTTSANGLVTARWGLGAAMLNSTTFYVAGGEQIGTGYLTSIEKYTP